MNKWPAKTFTHTNHKPKVARELANELRTATGQTLEAELDFEPILDLGGFDFRPTDLKAPTSGLNGLLQAMNHNRFRIVVDPRPHASNPHQSQPGLDMDDFLQRRSNFIIAHEIGHSFFFWRAGGKQPQRSVPVGAIGGVTLSHCHEELFCEEFARQLIIPREIAYRSEQSPEVLSKRFGTLKTLAELAIKGSAMGRVIGADSPKFLRRWEENLTKSRGTANKLLPA